MTTEITAYIPVEQLSSDLEPGQLVEYEDETYGTITEVYTENFEFPGGTDPDSDLVEVDASEDEPVYLVAKQEGGSEPMLGDDITAVDREDVFGEDAPDPKKDLDKVEAEMSSVLDDYESVSDIHSLAGISELREYDLTGRTAEELVSVADVPGVSRGDVGQAPWPESWRESDKPARLIALDAWADFNASHTGCVREMRGRVRRVNAFCAAFKDSILQWEGWRK
jgi:hypothetical protein